MLKYNTVSCYGSWKYLDVAMIRLECTTKCDVLWILYTWTYKSCTIRDKRYNAGL